MPYISRAGARIHFDHERSGGLRTVVLQHPLCSEPGCFEETSLKRTFLEAGYNVILPTSIAHGASSSPRDPARYQLAERAADVLAILDELGVERTAYVGYSMGTWIGCGLIAAAPERIVGASFGGFDPLRGAHSCGIPRAVTRSKFGRLLLGVYALWPESRIDIKRCDIPSLQQCFDALYEPMPRITQLRHPHLPLHFWSTHGDFYTPKMKRIAALLEAPIDLFDGHHFTASSDERFVECIFAHVDAAWERTLAAKTPDQRERM